MFADRLKGRNLKPGFSVFIIDALDVTLASHDNGTLVVNLFRDQIQDTLDLSFVHSSGRNATRLLNDHGHGDAFVQ